MFGPVLFVAMTMTAATKAMAVFTMAHYCVSVPLHRQSQQEEGSAGMKMVLKMVPSEQVAEPMDKRAGK